MAGVGRDGVSSPALGKAAMKEKPFRPCGCEAIKDDDERWIAAAGRGVTGSWGSDVSVEYNEETCQWAVRRLFPDGCMRYFWTCSPEVARETADRFASLDRCIEEDYK